MKKTVRLIATSDLHGKFYPWLYALDKKDTSGSMAQLSEAVREYKTGETILVDAGDTLQDNLANFFVGKDIHPMVKAINKIGYDICVPGNHDINYGMDVLKDTISDMKAEVVLGNIFCKDGELFAGKGYTIMNKGGVNVAFIGMITPNIVRWDKENLKGYIVRNPIDEIRKTMNEIKGKYDFLVGVFHIGLKHEYGVSGSSVQEICEEFPQFDVVISSHEHKSVPGIRYNGVLVVQNQNMARTMSIIDLEIEEDNDGCTKKTVSSDQVMIGEFKPDPEILRILEDDHKSALKYARKVIGTLEGKPLVPEDSSAGLPVAILRDTPLINLINTVMMQYSGTSVAACALFDRNANIAPGHIRRCDVSNIYKFDNMLYKVRMTGRQLRMYMEWSAGFFNTVQDGDEITENPEWPMYNYDIFDGVKYVIDLSREAGDRIQDLAWPDGNPVADDEVIDVAVNDYRANVHLLIPGEIYEEGDVPELVESDIGASIGTIRELIADYIVNERHGLIIPDESVNWKIVL